MPKTKRKEDATDNAALQAKAQLEGIIEMVEALEAAKEDDKAREEAKQAIHEDPLEVAVRSGREEIGMETLILPKIQVLIDELDALLDNAIVGVLGGEHPARTVVRLKEMKKLVRDA